MAIGKWTHPNLEDYLEEPMHKIRMCVAEWMKEYTHGAKRGWQRISPPAISGTGTRL